MDNFKSWTAEDEAIIATNMDATECKKCAVDLGYWKDDYISFFVKHADRKAPEINRGYYARVRAMEMFIHQFIERCDTKCQIINLGCGYDTLYWRLKDTTKAIENFIEMDFPAVAAKKCQIIMRNKPLLDKISTEEGGVVVRAGELYSAGYQLVGCDLRCPERVVRAWEAARARPAAPTLLLAECALVYVRQAAADALLAAAARRWPRGAALLYEQTNLADRFGAVMLRNLAARGCGLAGAAHCSAPAAGAARLRAAGWARARCWDMRRVWRALDAADRARAEALEPLDEAELLHQLHAHYALALATNGADFADMELDADPADPADPTDPTDPVDPADPTAD